MSTEKTTEHHFEFDGLEAKLEGVGKDAEIVTNDKGGKQSKTPMALHLVDPQFLKDWVGFLNFNEYDLNNIPTAMLQVAMFMKTLDKTNIFRAITTIENDLAKALVRIAKVLQYGADRYEPNNWRLIPQESHINHALIHLVAHLIGDKQDNHLDHALCRLMMAYATEKSSNFSYTEYIPQGEDVHGVYIGNLDVKDFKPGAIYEVNNNHPDFKSINKLQEGYDKFMRKYKYDCDYKGDNK